MKIVIAKQNKHGDGEEDGVYTVALPQIPINSKNGTNKELNHLKLCYELLPGEISQWKQSSQCVIPVHDHVDTRVHHKTENNRRPRS
jgi:hypothetical protein